MFHIVGLEYPCFDTDLIFMCSRITAPVWASCVWLLHSSHSRDPPPPRAYQLALSEETERKCDLFVLFGHDLLFVTVRTNVKSFRPPLVLFKTVLPQELITGETWQTCGQLWNVLHRTPKEEEHLPGHGSQRVEQTWTPHRSAKSSLYFCSYNTDRGHLKVLCSEK